MNTANQRKDGCVRITDQTETELSVSTQLGYDRTSLAHDRTLMAWIRTATSLISFGFTLYKFFELQLKSKSEHGQWVGPREFAMLMIAIGLFALAVSTIQYRMDRQRLKAQYPNIPKSMSGVIATLIAILGIVAFVAVILRR